MAPGEPNPLDRPADSSLPPSSTQWFGNLDQSSFDVEFYNRVLQSQPDNVQVLKLLGELYARQGKHDLALAIDQKLYALNPDDAVVSYNLACSLAMQNAPGDGMVALARALELGYNDFNHLEVDPDLDNLRSLPEFQELLRKFGVER